MWRALGATADESCVGWTFQVFTSDDALGSESIGLERYLNPNRKDGILLQSVSGLEDPGKIGLVRGQSDNELDGGYIDTILG